MKRGLSHMHSYWPYHSTRQGVCSLFTIMPQEPPADSTVPVLLTDPQTYFKMLAVWYSNTGGWRHSPTPQRILLCPSGALTCGFLSDSQNLGTFWITHCLLRSPKDSPCTGEKFTHHINLLRKTLVLVLLTCQRKLLKNILYLHQKEAKGNKLPLHPEPKTLTATSPQHGPLHISMGKNNNIHSRPSMAGVNHHKGLTPKLAWESRTRIPQHCEYRGIPTNNCFSWIRSDTIRAVYTLSHTHQWGIITTGRLILWYIHQDVRNVCSWAIWRN